MHVSISCPSRLCSRLTDEAPPADAVWLLGLMGELHIQAPVTASDVLLMGSSTVPVVELHIWTLLRMSVLCSDVVLFLCKLLNGSMVYYIRMKNFFVFLFYLNQF